MFWVFCFLHSFIAKLNLCGLRIQLNILAYSKCQRCGISGTLNKSIFYRDRLRNAHEDGTGVEVFNYEHCAGDALDGIEHLAKVAELGEKFLPKS